jgi:DnaK suppressor protein
MSVVEGSSLHASTQEMLLRERAAVASRIKAIEREALSLELETDGIPSSSFESEQALTNMLEGRLADIDAALARIDGGTYGVCADCAQPIPPRRLEVQPFATLCVNCKSVADKRAARKLAAGR